MTATQEREQFSRKRSKAHDENEEEIGGSYKRPRNTLQSRRIRQIPASTTTLQPRDGNIQQLSQVEQEERNSSLVAEFDVPESEIRIVGLIGTGDHSLVYRITAGGQTYALKVVRVFTIPFICFCLSTNYFLVNSTNILLL